MARGSIKGISVEINGETTKLQKALGEVNHDTRGTQENLKAVEKALKLDPGNLDLVNQKQKLLGEQVENTRKKLETLKEADKTAKEQLANGEIGKDDYEALQREILLTEASLKNLERQSEETADEQKRLGATASDAGEEIADAGKKVKKSADDIKEMGERWQKAGEKISNVGKGMTVGLTAPLMGLVTAAGVAWKEIDDSLDGIATATGATGESLEGLQQSFKNVYKTIPAEAADVSEAIGEINTQFGLTGEALEDATAYATKFASINNAQLSPSVKGAKGVMEALGLETKDFGRVLDAVTVASQDTGKSTDSLFDVLKKGAPQINAMNLGVEEAALLLGRMEQAGLDSSRIMGGLTRAQGTAAKEGKTLNVVLSDFNKFANSGASETEVLNQAVTLFGTRNGPAMAQAAKQGVFDFDALADSVRNAAGAVETTFEATLDPIDNAQIAMNNLKIAGGDLFDAIQVAGTPALEGLVEALQSGTEKLSSMSPEAQELAVKIGAILVAAGPAITVLGKLSTGAGKIVTSIGSATSAIGEKGFAGALSGLIGPGGKVMLAVAAIGLLAVAGKKIYDEMQPGTKAVRDFVKAAGEMDDAYRDSVASLDATGTSAAGIVDELKKLEKQTSLTADEQLRMATLVDQLNTLYPNLNLQYDAQAKALSMTTAEIERQMDAIRAQIALEIHRERWKELLEEETEITRELADAKQKLADGVGMTVSGYGEMYDVTQKIYEEGKLKQNVDQLIERQKENARQQGLVTDAYQETVEILEAAGTAMSEYRKETKDTADVVVESNARQEQSEDDLLIKLLATNEVRKELQEENKEVVQDYYDTLERVQDNYLTAIENFGNKEFDIRKASAAELKAYQEEMLAAYLSYESNMNILSKKVPADVLDEIRKLGPEGAHIIQEYVNMTDEELQPYIQTWSSLTGEAMDAALEELKDHPGKAAEEAINTVTKTRDELRKGIDEARRAAKDTVDAYTDTATGLPVSAEEKAKDAVDKLKGELAKGRHEAKAEAEKTGDSYAEGLAGKKSKVALVADEMAKGAKGKFGISAYAEGQNVGETFRRGILSKIDVVKGAGAQLGNAAPAGLKNVLQIKSPSRVMRGLADDTADGYELQLYDRVKDIEKAGQAMVDPLTRLGTSVPELRQSQLAMGSLSASIDPASLGSLRQMSMLLNEYLPMLAKMQVVIDSNRLVGEIAPAIDRQLGTLALQKGRGV